MGRWRGQTPSLLGRAALIVGVALGSSGCSFVFVSTPPAHVERLGPMQPLKCTSSRVAPVIDTFLAGAQLVAGGYALERSDGDYSQADRKVEVGVRAGFLALFTASAIYGYIHTGRCAAAKKERAHRGDDIEEPMAPGQEGSPPLKTSAPPTPAPPAPDAGGAAPVEVPRPSGSVPSDPTPSSEPPVPPAP